VRRQLRRRKCRDRRFQKSVRRRRICQQRFDLTPQIGIVAAGCLQEISTVTIWQVEHGLTEVVDASPAVAVISHSAGLSR
jgi:hypothetical protein